MEYNEGLGSIRTKKAPKKTGIEYKVFYQKDGKLYPPMVANPGGVDTPIGVWLDADAAPIVGNSKTGRPQVKNGGKGTQGGSGTLAYRPGWHLGLSAEIISYLKSHGFRWSPFNKAWQRQNTPEGRRKALEFAKKFFPKEEKKVEETKEEIKEDNNKLQQDDKGYTFGDESTISDDFPKIYIQQDKEHLEYDYLKICDVNPEYTINPAYNGEHHTMPVLFVRDYKHHSAVDAVDFRFIGHGYNLVIATVNKKHLTLQVKCDVLDIYKKYIVMLAKSINEKRIAKGLKPMEIPDEYKQFDKDRIHKNKQLQLAKAKMKMAAARLKLINMGMGDITYEMD